MEIETFNIWKFSDTFSHYFMSAYGFRVFKGLTVVLLEYSIWYDTLATTEPLGILCMVYSNYHMDEVPQKGKIPTKKGSISW